MRRPGEDARASRILAGLSRWSSRIRVGLAGPAEVVAAIFGTGGVDELLDGEGPRRGHGVGGELAEALNAGEQLGSGLGQTALQPVRQEACAPPHGIGAGGRPAWGLGGGQRRRGGTGLSAAEGDAPPHTSLNVA